MDLIERYIQDVSHRLPRRLRGFALRQSQHDADVRCGLERLVPLLVALAGLAAGKGALLVINFLLVGLANINPDLQAIYELTPLYFYQGGSAVQGVDWTNLLGLAGIALILSLLAWWSFQRREIRVGGEGGWKLPKLALGGRRN